MIEITTGIMFLLASMYGAGTLTADDIANAQTAIADSTENTASVINLANREDLKDYLREHFADTPILMEIARCESTFTHFREDGSVVRGRVNNADVGVMQINEKYHLETSEKLGYDIHTVEGNVAYAKYLYEKSGAQPWSASSPCWGKALAMN